MKSKYILHLFFLVLVISFVAKLSSPPQTMTDDNFTIMLYEDSDLGVFANGFRRDYIGDKVIEVIYYSGDSYIYGEDQYNQYVSDLSNMLIAGNAPDVFFLPDEMLLNMGGSNLIVNIYDFIENDPEFNTDDYYMNVISAYEQNGRLPVMPIKYQNFYIGIRPEFLNKTKPKFDSLETISVEQMLELYFSIPFIDRDIYKIEGNMHLTKAFTMTPYLDIATRSINFTSENFINMAETFKEHGSNTSYDDEDTFNTIVYYKSDDLDFQNCVFATFNDIYPHAFLPCKPMYSEADITVGSGSIFTGGTGVGPSNTFVNYTPLVTSDGRQIIHSRSLVAINANSDNKDIAWEFIKYALNRHGSSIDGYFENTLNKELNTCQLNDSLLIFNDKYLKLPMTDEVEKDFSDTADFLLKDANRPKFAMYEYSPTELKTVLENYMLTDQSAYDLAVYMQNMMTTFFEERD